MRVLQGIELNTQEVLDYDTVLAAFKQVMDQLAEIYVNTMNTIHYMHDKYAYEAGRWPCMILSCTATLPLALRGCPSPQTPCLRSSTPR